MASLQALYTDSKTPVKSTYREVSKSYGVQPAEVDFYNRETIFLINDATNRSTRGLIPYAVLPQEIYGAKMFMLSSLYFKGQWKVITDYPYVIIHMSLMQNLLLVPFQRKCHAPGALL